MLFFDGRVPDLDKHTRNEEFHCIVVPFTSVFTCLAPVGSLTE